MEHNLLEQILTQLHVTSPPDQHGAHTAFCPFHNDGHGAPPHQPNLRIFSRGFKCHACGEHGNLVKLADKLGIDTLHPHSDITYDYRDEAGKLLYQVVRRAGKKFHQRRPDGNGGWQNRLNGIPPVLYRLPEILTAPPSAPIYIAEGEKDADRLARAGLVATTNSGGAGKWRGECNKALRDRDVIILPDNDDPGRKHGQMIATSLKGIARSIRVVELPGLPVKGDVSDWLDAGHTVEELQILAAFTDAWQGSEVADERIDAAFPTGNSPYRLANGGIVWDKAQREGIVPVQLCNFTAQIIGDVEIDDGAERIRQFEINAQVAGGMPHQFTIPASQFAGMRWVTEHLGARATVAAGQGMTDRLREAIQRLSEDIHERAVYAHSGWRQVGNEWLYLHGGGGIGPDGSNTAITVELGATLSHLRLPSVGYDIEPALQVSLNLLDLAPLTVTAPLVGALFLAPLIEILGAERPDFTLWMLGPSGVFKSELAALAQGHFGDFTRLTLPASFMATGNGLERLMFAAKDAILVVDDFHPATDRHEAMSLEQTASRLLRATGNASGRQRMRSDTSIRAALPPRCLAVATAERQPGGHSNTARAFFVPVEPGSVNVAKLSAAQAQRHLLPYAMAGYIRFLADHFSELRETLPALFRELRDRMYAAGAHYRSPGQVAHLYLGLETFLSFAEAHGAIVATGKATLLAECLEALQSLGEDHNEALREVSPAQRFIDLLRDGLASRVIYLEKRGGGVPDHAERWGWIEHHTSQYSIEYSPSPGATVCGIADSTWIYLYPETAYRYAVESARRAGEQFSIDQRSLWKRLHEAGCLEPCYEGGKRRNAHKLTSGSSERVIKLRTESFFPTDTPELMGTSGDRDASQPPAL